MAPYHREPPKTPAIHCNCVQHWERFGNFGALNRPAKASSSSLVIGKKESNLTCPKAAAVRLEAGLIIWVQCKTRLKGAAPKGKGGIRHGKDVYRDLERAVGCRDVRDYVRPSKRWESAQPLG